MTLQIIHGNENYVINDSNTAISEIFEKINEVFESGDSVFSHLIVDGIDVYENHEVYLGQRLNEIKTVEIVSKQVHELTWETMVSIQNYLEGAIPALSKLVDNSFESFSDKTWVGLEQLAEGMQWILQFKAVVANATKKPSNWDKIEESIQVCEESFATLLPAVESKDTVLIIDVLSYEVKPAFESLNEHLKVSLRDEEFLKDVN
jgi:hypothetical protein